MASHRVCVKKEVFSKGKEIKQRKGESESVVVWKSMERINRGIGGGGGVSQVSGQVESSRVVRGITFKRQHLGDSTVATTLSRYVLWILGSLPRDRELLLLHTYNRLDAHSLP